MPKATDCLDLPELPLEAKGGVGGGGFGKGAERPRGVDVSATNGSTTRTYLPSLCPHLGDVDGLHT